MCTTTQLSKIFAVVHPERRELQVPVSDRVTEIFNSFPNSSRVVDARQRFIARPITALLGDVAGNVDGSDEGGDAGGVVTPGMSKGGRQVIIQRSSSFALFQENY